MDREQELNDIPCHFSAFGVPIIEDCTKCRGIESKLFLDIHVAKDPIRSESWIDVGFPEAYKLWSHL